VLRGVAPVVVAVVVHALWSFGRAAVRSPLLGLVGVTAVAGRFVGMAEIPVLLGAASLLWSRAAFRFGAVSSRASS